MWRRNLGATSTSKEDGRRLLGSPTWSAVGSACCIWYSDRHGSRGWWPGHTSTRRRYILQEDRSYSTSSSLVDSWIDDQRSVGVRRGPDLQQSIGGVWVIICTKGQPSAVAKNLHVETITEGNLQQSKPGVRPFFVSGCVCHTSPHKSNCHYG